MCTKLVFFLYKKNHFLNFEILWISSTPMMPDGFPRLSGCHADVSRPSGVFRTPSEWFYLRKTLIFDSKSTDFPSWTPELIWSSIYDEINGSRPSEGAQRATGAQVRQKTSRNFISGPASPLRGILGCLEVEIHLNSLMYTSFTSPLSAKIITSCECVCQEGFEKTISYM